jgi:hypothetical protein
MPPLGSSIAVIGYNNRRIALGSAYLGLPVSFGSELTSRTVNRFPDPAASNRAGPFRALGFPGCFCVKGYEDLSCRSDFRGWIIITRAIAGWPSHLSLEGFSASQPKAADDATFGGVPAPLPLASASAGLRSHSQFRLPCQPASRRIPATLFSVAERCGAIEPSHPPHPKDSSGSRFLDLPALWWTHASDRKAHRGPDPTPFSALSFPMCRMKPQLPARPIPVFRHEPASCVSSASYRVTFHSPHEPSHACSTHKTRPDLQPTRSFTLRHILALPRVSPQQHSSPIASVAPAPSFKSLY